MKDGQRCCCVLTFCVCRILELHPEPDACRWLPGARFNIAECALSGELGCETALSGHAHPFLASRRCPAEQAHLPAPAAAGPDRDRPAIVWADEAAPTELHSLSLGQLAQRSAHVAEALRAAGLQPGKSCG